MSSVDRAIDGRVIAALDQARDTLRLRQPPDNAWATLCRRCAEELPETLLNLQHEKIVGAAREANQVLDKLSGPRRVGNSIQHPWQALAYATRADNVGTTTQGGYLVDTLNLPAAEALLSLMVVGRLGLTGVSPGAHNVSMPKVTTPATTYWLSTESTQVTESDQTFGQLSFTPHTVGGYTEISRLLLQQSDAANVVANDLSRKIARAVQVAMFNGPGTAGQPHGVLGIPGVNTTSGTSFALATAMTAASDVADALEDGNSPGWAVDKATAFALRQRQEATNSSFTLWRGPQTFGTLADYPAAATSGIPANTAIFGCWKFAALAVWGGLTVEVNPFANFTAGIVGLRALATVDFGLVWPAAFTTVSSIT